MIFLLIYKGSYTSALTGPEMRNIGLAKALLASGNKVILAGVEIKSSVLPEGANFVFMSSFISLFKAFFSADVVVLHGGGPLLLLLNLLAGFMGKRIVLDAYSQHWIELECSNEKKHGRFFILKRHSIACFNAWRNFFGVLTFDLIITANQRQKDLLRGMQALFTLTDEFFRIYVIPFGCEIIERYDKDDGRYKLYELSGGSLRQGDFIVGWLGGVYEWFDMKKLLISLAPAMLSEKKIKLVFFGVSSEKKKLLTEKLPDEVGSQVVFLPWVKFEERFEYWCGLDLSLVWGEEGAENDYASRTRNFDCLSLGLPVLQNKGDEWGERIAISGAGVVTDQFSLSEDLLKIIHSPQKLARMAQSMAMLAPQFYWSIFSQKLVLEVCKPPMSFLRRLWGSVIFIAFIPPLLLAGLCYGLKKIRMLSE